MHQGTPTSLDPAAPCPASHGSDQGAAQPGLIQIALHFLKIGTIGFGGGMAVIAIMERECVTRRKWVDPEVFLHGVGLGQILGPFAVNTALFVGYRLRGIVGGLVAAGAFLFPSVTLVIGLSWLYFTFHHIPSLQAALAGIGPMVVALILSAAVSMGRKALRSPVAWLLAAAACLVSLGQINPIWVLGLAGMTGLLLHLGEPRPQAAPTPKVLSLAPVGFIPLALSENIGSVASANTAAPFFGTIAWTFLKVGCVFFGGGFVLVAILHQQLVSSLHWLTPGEFIDGVAISQLTPGPVAVLATFAGYHVGGIGGALLATLALFTPALLLMLTLSRFYERVRREPRVQEFLAGVVPAVIGLIVGAGLILAPDSLAIRQPATLVMATFAFLALVRWRWHPAIVLGIGAAAGALMPAWFR